MMVNLPIKLVIRDPHIRAVAAATKSRSGHARDGGKPAASRLLKLVKPHGKRAAFLRWFLADPKGRTVGACMANFGMKRPNVLAYWTAIHKDHGIGYALSNNTITVLLPPKKNAANIFGVLS